STTAIRVTLERRLAALEQDTGIDAAHAGATLAGVREEWEDLDGQEQADFFTATPQVLAQREQAEVSVLLELARRCESTGPDAKAAVLLNLIYDTQQTERDAAVKVLVFTEFVPTQEMLCRFLEDRGFVVAVLNGSMDLAERQRAQHRFAGPAQVLISTDAGGEGINLQFCHVVVNYDMPWNPMRLEQRIGRVDRIGQMHPVYAHNLVLADTVEYRVREVLEEKLTLIHKEFGIDKTGDVLDSGQAGALFEDIYLAGIIHPDGVSEALERVVHQVREQAQQADLEQRNLVTSALEPLLFMRVEERLR
ncbi:MAG: C-terminal helicase domain-containing protein, partial [Caldilinea sp.]